MAPASTHPCIILAPCFFLLMLSFQSHHVAAASSPISFSFDFSNTSNYRLQDLSFEGDATLNGALVDLTCNPTHRNCSGRMSYNHPVSLYDNHTGAVASFNTTFTFAINLLPNTTGRAKGDGMTFFLSGYPSRLPPRSYNSLLGLTNSSETIASGASRFVAVEFDTYANPKDPTEANDHIGIDLNSIISVMTTRLPDYSLNGTMTATITYDHTTATLEAILHFDANHSLDPVSVKTQLPYLIDSLPPEVAVGFSASTGGYVELHQIHSWSFNSTMAVREPTGAIGVHPRQGGTEVFTIGRPVLGGVVLFVIIWLSLAQRCWIRTRDSFGKDCRLKRFDYHDLSVATGGFSDINKIGEGGFGVVYRGSLEMKQIAVKRILKDSRGEFKDFLAEVGTISRTGHMNVVGLEGWCCSIRSVMSWCLFLHNNVNLFLVYELVPNGNLYHHLHERLEVLSWPRRYKIVKGLCSALYYLHHQCHPFILHRDIKPSNILLDDEFNAKLGDFGLSRAAQDSHVTSLQTGMAAGTIGYMDPLCMKDGQVNLRRSSDVYSFGIVLLEIAHGKFDMEKFRKLHTNKLETFVDDVADEKLAGQFDRAQMERVIDLGLRCSEPDDERKRPALDVAILQFLENGGEFPLP